MKPENKKPCGCNGACTCKNGGMNGGAKNHGCGCKCGSKCTCRPGAKEACSSSNCDKSCRCACK